MPTYARIPGRAHGQNAGPAIGKQAGHILLAVKSLSGKNHWFHHGRSFGDNRRAIGFEPIRDDHTIWPNQRTDPHERRISYNKPCRQLCHSCAQT